MTGRVEIESRYPPVPAEKALAVGTKAMLFTTLPKIGYKPAHKIRHRHGTVTVLGHSVTDGEVFMYCIENDPEYCSIYGGKRNAKPCIMWAAPWELDPNSI